MSRNIFRRLYSQIVLPLLAAAIVVGIVATVVAVYFLSNLTDSWVDEIASGVGRNLVNRIEAQIDSMMSMAEVASADPRLVDALAGRDPGAVRDVLASTGASLHADNLMLLDADGVVVATAGLDGITPGASVSRSEGIPWRDVQTPYSLLLDVAGKVTLSALHPVEGPDGREYTLCISRVVNDQFLRSLTLGAGCASAFYDEDLAPVVSRSPDNCQREEGGENPVALKEALSRPAPEVLAALEEAAISGEGTGSVAVLGTQHRIVAQRIDFADSAAEGSNGYLVSLISQRVSDDARTTTTNLIAMWSIVAVLALVGLGGWVARRVSDPIVSLTEGAQRIADGDFSTKIKISGRNEITELADSFNEMTVSLKDRSESLTKKVLELATLYEMSRALGSTLDMGKLLESVLDSALRIFGADLGYVTMRNRETGELEILARSGAVPSRVDDRALRSSMSEWVIREARPLIFNPAGEGSKGQVEVVTGAMAALCVPLVSSEGTIGAITVGSQDPEFRFGSDDVRLLSTIANHVTIAVGNIDLFSSLQEAYLATVRSLAVAVDAKDPYTRGHSEGVALCATVIAEQMGLSHDQRIALEMAAYLHDIGKIGIKEAILLKPGKLTEEEMSQMRHHPLIGASILKPVAFPWPIVPVVRHHHERWDGEGYPAGLKGEEIPLLARILTVADAYEAMIADRPYRSGRTMEEGILELERCAGTQFDAAIVRSFVEALADQAAADGLQDPLKPEEEVRADEAQAIFVALSEGMLLSFRRLGGPRLATNAETDLNMRFAQEGIPLTVVSGKVNVQLPHETPDGSQIELMRQALLIVGHTLGRLSGYALVGHFYADAMSALSERMRRIAVGLEFRSG